MAKNDDTIEREIDRIRLQIYEKTKDMTPFELTEYYRKSGEASAKKYGFELIENAREKTPHAANVTG